MQDLCNLLEEIGSRPQTTITQVGDLEFKIELGGKLFEAYGRLKRIQSEITEKVGDKFELYTFYGEGQDAILRFLPKEDVVINPASESLVLDPEMFKE